MVFPLRWTVSRRLLQCVLASTAEDNEDEDFVHLGVLKMILMEQLKVAPFALSWHLCCMFSMCEL